MLIETSNLFLRATIFLYKNGSAETNRIFSYYTCRYSIKSNKKILKNSIPSVNQEKELYDNASRLQRCTIRSINNYIGGRNTRDIRRLLVVKPESELRFEFENSKKKKKIDIYSNFIRIVEKESKQSDISINGKGNLYPS